MMKSSLEAYFILPNTLKDYSKKEVKLVRIFRHLLDNKWIGIILRQTEC